MTSLQNLQQPVAASTSSHVGQGTAIEQSRAAAEVYAAVIAAKQSPRNQIQAISAMEQSCEMKTLAEKAFFRFSRGGQAVTGPTVHLARELARCWGNIQYGVSELRRDDTAGQSEMQAFAWDMESNARSASVFIVPHKRDKRGGPEAITDMRDIYENNANAGARRVREAIFAVLPLWFTEQAQELCRTTLANDGVKNGQKTVPLPQRIAKAIETFRTTHGITEEQLVDKVGRPTSKWDATDLSQLMVIFQSIKRGEIDKNTEFPEQRVTAAELTTPKATTTPVADDGEQGFLPDDPDLTAHLTETP